MFIFDIYYIAIKAAFLFGLVHSFVKFETLQKSWFFLGLLYTAGVALAELGVAGRAGTSRDPALADLAGRDSRDRRDLLQVAPAVRRGLLFWMLLMAGLACRLLESRRPDAGPLRRTDRMIHFECPACASPFEVDDRLAGRAGRCKDCGGRMKIPSNGAVRPWPPQPPAAAAVAAAAGPRLTPVAAAGLQAPALARGRPAAQLARGGEQPGGPGADQHGRHAGLRRKPAFVDEPSIPGPYKMASAPSLPAIEAGRTRRRGPSRAAIAGHGQVPEALSLAQPECLPRLRPVPDAPAPGAGQSEQLADGAGGDGGSSCSTSAGSSRAWRTWSVIPFRESPIQGILFLIPPITFFYLYQNWHKVHRPVKRIVGPILTIALVVLAFVAEPWVKGEGKPKGSINDQLQSGARSMKEGLQGKIGKVAESECRRSQQARRPRPRSPRVAQRQRYHEVDPGTVKMPGKSFDRPVQRQLAPGANR